MTHPDNIHDASAEERAKFLKRASIRTLLKLSHPAQESDDIRAAAEMELRAREHLRSLNNMLVARIGLVLAVIALTIMGINALPSVQWTVNEKNYTCVKKSHRKPANIILTQEGLFSLTCQITQGSESTKAPGNCSEQLGSYVKKGFNCKKTKLDLDLETN